MGNDPDRNKNSSKEDGLGKIRSLLRRGTDRSTSKPKPCKSSNKNHPDSITQDDIKSVLNQHQSKDDSIKLNKMEHYSENQTSINELLNTNTAYKTKQPLQKNESEQNNMPDIKSALDKTINTEQTSSKISKPEKKLSDQNLALKNFIDIPNLNDKSETSKNTQARSWKSTINIAGVLFILLTVVIVYQFLQKPEINKLESPVAQQVMLIVSMLERYREENNKIPERLSLLPEFPEDAVEWPISHYEARLIIPKLELFLVPDTSTGYIVIGRQGDDAWAYFESSEPALKRVPAY